MAAREELKSIRAKKNKVQLPDGDGVGNSVCVDGWTAELAEATSGSIRQEEILVQDLSSEVAATCRERSVVTCCGRLKLF